MNILPQPLLQSLHYIEQNNYEGYDPYDILNSKIPFLKLGKWPAAIATQIHKRLPIQYHKYIGIKKGRNAKAIGLFISSYCKLYTFTQEQQYLDKAYELYHWLVANTNTEFKGLCWGYNFAWANPEKIVPSNYPSAVVTGTIGKAFIDLHQITFDAKVLQSLYSIADYICSLPITTTSQGKCISYTHLNKVCVYNASLLGAEILAYLGQTNMQYAQLAKECVSFVIHYQQPNGSWMYSYNVHNATERKQIDFHQGFVLESLYNIQQHLKLNDTALQVAIVKGMEYYTKEQFNAEGAAHYRMPKHFPVDIHNQAQGIITHSLLAHLHPSYKATSNTILSYTLHNLYNSKQGYFYYRKHKWFTNKNNYMRWSNAWMLWAQVMNVCNSN
jgi:hypothetical protein